MLARLTTFAIDDQGRVLAIEVKPGASTKGLMWTPVQVAMYVRLLRSWVSPDETAAAESRHEVVAGSAPSGCLMQRTEI